MTMPNYKNILKSVKHIADNAREKNIAHLYAATPEEGKIQVEQHTMVNFGSCSYLGLEYNESLKKGAKKAIDNYGTQFSASRAYVSCELYHELEQNLEEMTNCKVVVAPTTTLGHISTIPVVVGNNDVVILDHQVHASVQTAVQLLKARGIKIEMIRHNNMEMLENRIIKLKAEYSNIWYMADGIYSMYGDCADMKQLTKLMNKYSTFNLYIDDAHGTSCYGKNGVGYVLSQVSMHKQMIVAISLNKAFASGGGAILFSDSTRADLVRSCGGPMITSGPMQPASLGAAIAASKIHLSNQINKFQEDLEQNIKYTNLIIEKLQLPIIAVNESPIFFIGISVPKLGYEMVSRMKNSGFYMNIGIFPAVPIKNTGIRFTITRLHTFQQISSMLNIFAKHYFQVLNEENYPIQKIYKAFKLKNPYETDLDAKVRDLLESTELNIEHYNSVSEIDKIEWDEMFKNEGAFNHDTLLAYEKTFNSKPFIKNNWEFDYVVIRDNNNKIVLSTFLTTSIQKDDIFSISEVSEVVELERKKNPYYLTSKVISVGCDLSIGNQIFIERTNPLWKSALSLFLEKVEELKTKRKADKVMLRGFKDNDEIQRIIEEKGYFSMEIPENNIIEPNWVNENEFLDNFNKKRRYYYRTQIKIENENFIAKVVKPKSEQDVKHYYEMYLSVWRKNRDLNTFALPYELFKNLYTHKDWQFVELFSKTNLKESCGVLINHMSDESCSPLILGMDYKNITKGNLYKFVLDQILQMSYPKNIKSVYLGITNAKGKRKIGAVQKKTVAYFQVSDHFNDNVIETYNQQVNKINA